MSKIAKFWDKSKKTFWAIITILLGIGVLVVAGILIGMSMVKKSVIDKLKKKTDDQLSKNDKIVKEAKEDIKNAKQTAYNVDDVLKHLDKKYGKLQ